MRGTPLGKQIRAQILARDGYRCKMCGRTKEEVPLEVDHIIPVADGGTDELNNLAALCRECKRGKSAYRFKGYTSMTVVPENVEEHFKFFHDDKFGDFERFHLYLYYKDGIHSGHIDGKFHHTWKISCSAYRSSSEPKALKNRRRKEETQVFLKKIKDELIAEGKRLVITKEGLCKV